MNLSPGKIRGLQQCATLNGIFTILALDHSPAYFFNQPAKYADIVAQKARLIAGLSERASAVLLDPGHGLPAALHLQALSGKLGMLLSVEDGSYQNPGGEQRAKILDGWGVEKIKKAGASAVKLFFYYHPDHAERAAEEELFVQTVAAACRRYDIPLFAEPLSYATEPADRPRVVVETARRISALEIDVLKVEFPVDAQADPDEANWQEACEALNAACQKPWALLSAGVTFETFAKQVKIACQAGASGFLAGRAIWGEASGLTGNAQDKFLHDVARPRLLELASIAEQWGRDWQASYPDAFNLPQEGWYADDEEGH